MPNSRIRTKKKKKFNKKCSEDWSKLNCDHFFRFFGHEAQKRPESKYKRIFSPTKLEIEIHLIEGTLRPFWVIFYLQIFLKTSTKLIFNLSGGKK